MKLLESLTDEELVERSATGSEAAFDALVTRHSPAVYRLALGVTGSHQEAEDILQETFLRVFKHLDRFSPSVGSFKTWVLAIARNQSINTYHSLKRRAARLFGDTWSDEEGANHDNSLVDTNSSDPETMLSIRQQHARVQDALRKLPERQRTALLLKAQEQMSYAEIASTMSASSSSVESLIFRARQRLLIILDEGDLK
ncbi:MAG: sigma-70 family RNA polymerase sigma factor [Thermodesulfobacteriota bacterium]